jgi:hypothetical protein
MADKCVARDLRGVRKLARGTIDHVYTFYSVGRALELALELAFYRLSARRKLRKRGHIHLGPRAKVTN